MRILFIHQNFPGQYIHLAPHLSKAGHEVVAITRSDNIYSDIVPTVRYSIDLDKLATASPVARLYETGIARAQAVARTAVGMDKNGFRPDVIFAHLGWGEALFLKDVWPDAKLIGYAEFFHRPEHDRFDAEFSGGPHQLKTGTLADNAMSLLGFAQCDIAVAPTQWQRSVFPAGVSDRIAVIHDGIDTDVNTPDPDASITLERAGTFKPGDPVITFAARNLEPARGYHVFMRALPAVLAACPNAHVVIFGGHKNSYSPRRSDGVSWQQTFLDEVRSQLDPSRIHFVGYVPHSVLTNALQVSAAHVYLSHPFVMGWSPLEAMSVGALVIGSNNQPVTEFIRHEHNGILVGFNDVAGLSRHIVDAINNPIRYKEIRHNARKTIIDRYDLRRVCLPAQAALIGSSKAASTTGGPAVPQ